MARKNPQQMAFARDVGIFINYAHAYATLHGMYFVLGEVLRPDLMQKHYYDKGLSKIEDRGPHGWRMALDWSLVYRTPVDGSYAVPAVEYHPLGDYWKSINPQKNIYGGDFKNFGPGGDAGHIERRMV